MSESKQQTIRDRTEAMLDDIRKELVRARQKFPRNRHQLAAFQEESGELTKALLKNQYEELEDHDVYSEAVQAAAMAIRVATEGDHSFSYDPAIPFDCL